MPSHVGPCLNRAVRLLVLIALIAAPTLNGATAHAIGIGGAIKSMKDKATKAASPKSSGATNAPPAFDDATLELTPELLDKLIACRKAANDVLKDRQKMVDREKQDEAEINELQTRNHDAIEANGNKRSEVRDCQGSEWEQLKQKKMQQAIMNINGNVPLMQKLTDLSTKAAHAQAAGDTATLYHINEEMYRALGIGRADTLAIEAKCGRVPPVHPAQVRIEALIKEEDDLLAKVRAMDEQAIRIEKEKCQLTEQQLAIAWDRIKEYLEGRGGYSDTEKKALAERRDELKPLAL